MSALDELDDEKCKWCGEPEYWMGGCEKHWRSGLSVEEVAALRAECDELRYQRDMAQGILDAYETLHPRAVKLLNEKRNFIVVAEKELYFMDVYRAIREHETSAGTWTAEDERIFQQSSARFWVLHSKESHP